MTAGVDHHERPERPRLKFSLRGLMVVVFGAAVGMALMRQQGNQWFDGLLAAVACWFALGLLQQVRDLWRTYSGRTDLPRAERWSCRFTIGWRLVVVLVILTYYIAPPLRQIWVDTADHNARRQYFGPYEPDQLHEGLLLLAIFVVLWSVVGSGSQRGNRTRSRRLVSGAAWCLAAIACLIIWLDQSMVYCLVYLALWGMEASQPLRFQTPGIALHLAGRAEPFVLRSAVAAGCVLVNLALLWQLARRWRQGTRQRLTWLGILVVPLGATVAHTVWLHTFGTYGLSAAWHEGLVQMGIRRWPVEAWAAVMLLAVIAASFVTCRLVWAAESLSRPAEATRQQWQPRYYHESRGCMFVLVVAMLAQMGSVAWQSSFFRSSLELFIQGLLSSPLNYLRAAILVLALQSLGWLGVKPRLAVASVRLDPVQFALLWPIVLLVVVSGAVTFAWLGFAIWLAPFCRWFSG